MTSARCSDIEPLPHYGFELCRPALVFAAAVVLMLVASACSLLPGHGIPSAIAAGCPAVEIDKPYPVDDISFGAMIDAMVKRQTSVRWEPTGNGRGVVRTVRRDPLTNSDVAVDMDVIALPALNENGFDACKRGVTAVGGMTLDGERLDARNTMQALTVLAGQVTEGRAPPKTYVPYDLPRVDGGYVQSNADGDRNASSDGGTPSASPPAANGTAGQSDDPGFAIRPLVIADHGLWCCVTVGQLASAFNGDGATARLHPGDSGQVWLDVTDPKGRWNGLHSFRLALRPRGQGDASPLTPVAISSDGRVVLADTAADGAVSRLIRQSFHLVPPSWPKLDLGTAYNRCLAGTGAGGSNQAGGQQCLDAELQRREAELNAGYRAKMATLTPDRKLALRDAERAWLKVRQQQCGLVPDVGPRDHQNRTYCLAAMDADRSGEIGAFQ